MRKESTTPDLLELSRHFVEASNRLDFDAMTSFYVEDGVFDTSALGMGVFEGREAIRGFFEDWHRAYENWDQVIEEFHDLGNGVTFAVLLQRGRPAGSSGFVAQRYAAVGAWTDGLIEWSMVHTDPDQARAAAERLAEERG